MTEPGARSPEIVGASLSMPAFLAYCLKTCQTAFSVNPLPHTVPARVTRLKILPFEIPAD